MPEISENAVLLIGASFQALQRLDTEDFGERICASAVTIIFACFYLEQTMDTVLNKKKRKRKM